MAEAERLGLADIGEIRHFRDSPHVLKQVKLAFGFEE